MAGSLLKQGFEAQAKSMREFGYPDVTASMIKGCHDKWLQHETSHGVIGMFAASAFEENPDIFGER